MYVNCPKIIAYAVKTVKFIVCIISEHPLKSISLIFKTETVGLCLVQKLNQTGGGGGRHGPLAPWPPIVYTSGLMSTMKAPEKRNEIHQKLNTKVTESTFQFLSSLTRAPNHCSTLPLSTQTKYLPIRLKLVAP